MKQTDTDVTLKQFLRKWPVVILYGILQLLLYHSPLVVQRVHSLLQSCVFFLKIKRGSAKKRRKNREGCDQCKCHSWEKLIFEIFFAVRKQALFCCFFKGWWWELTFVAHYLITLLPHLRGKRTFFGISLNLQQHFNVHVSCKFVHSEHACSVSAPLCSVCWITATAVLKKQLWLAVRKTERKIIVDTYGGWTLISVWFFCLHCSSPHTKHIFRTSVDLSGLMYFLLPEDVDHCQEFNALPFCYQKQIRTTRLSGNVLLVQVHELHCLIEEQWIFDHWKC